MPSTENDDCIHGCGQKPWALENISQTIRRNFGNVIGRSQNTIFVEKVSGAVLGCIGMMKNVGAEINLFVKGDEGIFRNASKFRLGVGDHLGSEKPRVVEVPRDDDTFTQPIPTQNKSGTKLVAQRQRIRSPGEGPIHDTLTHELLPENRGLDCERIHQKAVGGPPGNQKNALTKDQLVDDARHLQPDSPVIVPQNAPFVKLFTMINIVLLTRICMSLTRNPEDEAKREVEIEAKRKAKLKAKNKELRLLAML